MPNGMFFFTYCPSMQYLPYRYWALFRPSSTAILRNFIPLMVSPFCIIFSDKRYALFLSICNFGKMFFLKFVFEKSGTCGNGVMIGVNLITLPINPFLFSCVPASDDLSIPFIVLTPVRPTIPPILGFFFKAFKGLILACALMFMHTMVKTRAKKVLDNSFFRFMIFRV